ncbi:methionine/alanine import family NSS transporter small subunit [Nocardiopsis sp. FIRDI 009]|nr:methionine/alanine import family NSS transporter small subunit [Nocardiopsis sp. FIRDI 009]
MSTSAIIMMAVSMLLLWGGLAAAIINLRRNPEEPEHQD